MGLFKLNHSKAAYRVDFAVYGASVVGIATLLLTRGPVGQLPAIMALVALGLVSWTAIEYALHRFVLHGMPPFRRWHAEHHQRPSALICTPTILSAALIATLVFLPALALGNGWRATALTLGVLTGYLAYSITHHATHHWRVVGPWLMGRKRWHALHHHRDEPCCYGVTSSLWDRVFGTTGESRDRIGRGHSTKSK